MSEAQLGQVNTVVLLCTKMWVPETWRSSGESGLFFVKAAPGCSSAAATSLQEVLPCERKNPVASTGLTTGLLLLWFLDDDDDVTAHSC